YEGAYPFEGEVNVNELETMKNDIRKIDPVHVQGNYSIQNDEIIFSFTICGKMILPCARTLVDVTYPFEIQTYEVFSISPYYGKGEEDNDIHHVERERNHLKLFIMENLALNIPFGVFTDNEVAYKQATLKGQGWQFIYLHQNQKSIDPRLQNLQSLL